ncbi:centromere protein J-like [Tigriopus californicus]|uniref:centromere protein J-like n=1 Tax=Tigriopus californicus TaxID=6832 RepID=UPI0027DA52B4|nr:centromere protein J-like [Tigriopus californicus]XP_059090440.1 centromere protein J-like [Tigriopus californicus]XP_059090441.1 centromere protein J-like [Tigriopus californicus]
MELELERKPMGNGREEVLIEDEEELDETGLGESSMDQTGFLLQRLQELKEWQKEQEMKLLRDQQKQMQQLVDQESLDDDTTIDQDFSSLNSYAATPQPQPDILQQYYSSSFESPDEDEEPEGQDVGQRSISKLDSSMPSWAQTESGHEPRTIKSNPRTPNIEEIPIVNPKKTFEELLAEKLGSEDAVSPALQDVPKVEQVPHGSPRTRSKTFLRKGSGLARYGGVGSPPKAFKRSRSTNSVTPKGDSNPRLKSSKSCSKLDTGRKVTPGSAKKTPPKRTISSYSVKSPPQKVSPPSQGNKLEVVPKKAKAIGSMKAKAPKTTNMLLPKSSLQPPEANHVHSDKENESPVYDSVEWSFREKIKKANSKHKQELEELAAFEALEEAACDSSFCSSSSKVQNLIGNVSSLPSPIIKPSSSSTPARPVIHSLQDCQADNPGAEDPSLGPSLLEDIQKFLLQRGAVIKDDNDVDDSPSDEHDVESEDDDDDTLKDQIAGRALPLQLEEVHEDDPWGSFEDREEANSGKSNQVRFQDRLDFSPPRIPKNSPSYMIWSIFSKERERMGQQATKSSYEKSAKAKTNSNSRPGRRVSNLKTNSNSPLSQLADFPGGFDDQKFADSFLNAKLIELEKEISQFRQENIQLQNARRKLNQDKKQFQNEKEELEKSKMADKKKLEEDKRRIKRDRALLEKSAKLSTAINGQNDKKAVSELEELQTKLSRLQEELQKKETKWTNSIGKLQETVKILEKENQHLHEENYKLKMKTVTSKVSTHLGDNFAKNPIEPQVISLKDNGSCTTTNSRGGGSAKSLQSLQSLQSPDSGFRSVQSPQSSIGTNNDSLPPSNPIYSNRNPITTPCMSFSPADSLDSNVTLVSSGDLISQTQQAPELKRKDQKVNVLSTKNTHPDRNNDSNGGGGGGGASEQTLADGSVELSFHNGNRKVISPDGKTTKVFYYNDDVKESLPSGLVKYFYAQTKTWHLTYPDKKEVLQFSNGQEEIRYPDGVVQITFPDGSVKRIGSDGSEDLSFPDGTKVEVSSNGDRTLLLANGQREIHTSDYKRREYPDGTIKTLFNNGRQETRYANGRVRVKNKDGSLLHDSLSETN